MIARACRFCGTPQAEAAVLVTADRDDPAAPAICLDCVLICGALRAKGYDTSPAAQRLALMKAEAQ